MSYGKVHDVFWEDHKIETLSDRAALLGLFMITGPHRNAIGCFRLGTGAITDIPRFGEWGIKGVSDALSELVDMGFIVRDDRTGWTFITNALKHDPIKGNKAAIHALSIAARVPKNTVVYQSLRENLEPQLLPHAEHLEGKDGWPMRSPIEGVSEGDTKPQRSPSPSPSPSPEPSPLPEPEKEDARERACLHDEFEDWYSGYPHKVGRGAAEKAFPSARKKTELAILIDGRDRYVRTKPPDRPWCNPATWLNQERWLDREAPADPFELGKYDRREGNGYRNPADVDHERHVAQYHLAITEGREPLWLDEWGDKPAAEATA